MKDPKKVKKGKKLAEWSHKNKEKLAQEAKTKESEPKLQHWDCHSCWGVRSSCLLHLPKR